MDGIFCAVHDWCPGDREALLQLHPHTVFYEDPGIAGAAFVAPDRSRVSSLAVSHLAERGRRRIGLVMQDMASTTAGARLAGYQAGLETHDLPFDPALVFDGGQPGSLCGAYDVATQIWSFPEAVAARAIDELVIGQKVDALVAHNDYWASVLIRQLQVRGLRVPQDVAVIGYMNHYLADWTHPALTSISPCQKESARVMVAMLEKMITEDGLPDNERQVLIEPRVITRAST